MTSAMIMAGCSEQKVESDNALQHQRDSLQAIIDNKDEELNELMSVMNEVQEGIARISEAEGRVTVAQAGPETGSQKEIIRENMEFIQEAMRQNRDMIDNLKDKLKKSTFNAEMLQKTIESLQAQVEKQNQQIQELMASLAERDIHIKQQDEEISNLNENVTNLTVEKNAQAETIQHQDRDLNSAWFVFGTKAELKEQKILQKGDVLKNGDFNTDYFTKIDIRKTRVINLYSKNANVLTTHPTGSYSLSKDSNGLYTLVINDSKAFWSVSRYLVVQVK